MLRTHTSRAHSHPVFLPPGRQGLRLPPNGGRTQPNAATPGAYLERESVPTTSARAPNRCLRTTRDTSRPPDGHVAFLPPLPSRCGYHHHHRDAIPATNQPTQSSPPKETRLPVAASGIPLKVLGSAFDQFLPWIFRHLLDNLRPKYRPVLPSGSFVFSPISVALPVLSPVECAPAYAAKDVCVMTVPHLQHPGSIASSPLDVGAIPGEAPLTLKRRPNTTAAWPPSSIHHHHSFVIKRLGTRIGHGTPLPRRNLQGAN